jgi:SAM-dependent methyltransferase
MIIHKLILQHLRSKDDSTFYAMQARDAISWIQSRGISIGANTSVLDLGCGHGIFGGELLESGCKVTFADEGNYLSPQFQNAPFRKVDLDTEGVKTLGSYDLVICSNVLEHLRYPEKFLGEAHHLLNERGVLYLSWTNWLSPWGGHEFSPFHYLGPNLGPKLFDRITGKKRIHTPGQNLFVTSIGNTLSIIKGRSSLKVKAVAPRYYPEFSFLPKLPLVREILTWNCAMLLQKR